MDEHVTISEQMPRVKRGPKQTLLHFKGSQGKTRLRTAVLEGMEQRHILSFSVLVLLDIHLLLKVENIRREAAGLIVVV